MNRGKIGAKPQDEGTRSVSGIRTQCANNISARGSTPAVNIGPVVIIRTATSADIPSIQHVARSTWADTYRDIIPEIVQAKILDRAYSTEALSISIGRGQAFLVAEADGDVAAYADADFDDRQMNLHRLYVSPNRQRLGLGARLLQAAIDEMLRKIQLRCSAAAEPSASNQARRHKADGSAGELPSPDRKTVASTCISSATGPPERGWGSPSPGGKATEGASRQDVPGIPLVAHVERDNPKARAFYKKIGFAEGKEENVVIGGISLPVIQISRLIARTL